MHLGLQLWPQNTTWDSLRECALMADDLGYDSLWTWDHFAAIQGDPYGGNFEGWQILAAWGAITKRVRIGMLVSGNTYRNPAVLANMATTLDHITAGRAILGVGAAWFEFEHKAYGIPFGTPGSRLAKLAESAALMRSLLDAPRTDHAGRYYKMTDAPNEPKPVQPRLPIMIGGGGERKTLRITAQYADMWHGFGDPDVIRHKITVLREHCAAVGRDPEAILPTCGGSVIIREDPKEVEAHVKRIRENSRIAGAMTPITGSPEQVAQRIAAYWRAGARGFIAGTPSPHDRETIERLAREVRPRVMELIEDEAAA